MTFGLGERALAEHARVARRGQIREIVFGAGRPALDPRPRHRVHGAKAVRDTILVAGVAGALAGTISMALGVFVAARSQRAVFEYELEEEERKQLETGQALPTALGINLPTS